MTSGNLVITYCPPDRDTLSRIVSPANGGKKRAAIPAERSGMDISGIAMWMPFLTGRGAPWRARP